MSPLSVEMFDEPSDLQKAIDVLLDDELAERCHSVSEYRLWVLAKTTALLKEEA